MAHRLLPRPNIKPTLGDGLVFAWAVFRIACSVSSTKNRIDHDQSVHHIYRTNIKILLEMYYSFHEWYYFQLQDKVITVRC